MLCSTAAWSLALIALLTGSSAQDNAVFLPVIIGSGRGYLGLGAIALAARGSACRQ